MNADLLPDPNRQPEEPSELETPAPEPWGDADEDTDLDYVEMPCTDGVCPEEEEENRWEAFIPDEDEWDPQPDPGDFRAEWNVSVLILAA